MLYHSYIAHKCLYYKHCAPILLDHDFDSLEQRFEAKHPNVSIVGFDLNVATARFYDRLTLKEVKRLILALSEYPEENNVSVLKPLTKNADTFIIRVIQTTKGTSHEKHRR